MSAHLQGTALLAIVGQLPWKPAAGERYIVLRVKNVGALVAKEGGAAGVFAHSIAPGTISDTVYSTIAKELQKGFKDKGVETDIQILQAHPGGTAPRKDLRNGFLFGVGAVGLGWLVWKYLGKTTVVQRMGPY